MGHFCQTSALAAQNVLHGRLDVYKRQTKGAVNLLPDSLVLDSKTAIDLGETKNIVGAFWQPKVVLVDFEMCIRDR